MSEKSATEKRKCSFAFVFVDREFARNFAEPMWNAEMRSNDFIVCMCVCVDMTPSGEDKERKNEMKFKHERFHSIIKVHFNVIGFINWRSRSVNKVFVQKFVLVLFSLRSFDSFHFFLVSSATMSRKSKISIYYADNGNVERSSHHIWRRQRKQWDGANEKVTKRENKKCINVNK